MTTNANVSLRLSIEGKDKASAELDRVGKAAAGMGERLSAAGAHSTSAAQRMEATTETSGRLSTALGALGDFAGHSEGKMRMAADAAGAFEDVLKVLPGPLGLAAGAIAGVTALLVLQRIEARQTQEAVRAAFGPELAADVQRLAGAYGLTREAALALGAAMRDTGQSSRDVELGLQAVLAESERVGTDATAAVLAFAGQLSSGADAADKLAGRLRQVGVELVKVNVGLERKAGLDGLAAATKESDDKIAGLTARLDTLRKTEQALATGQAGEFANLQKRTSIFDRFGAVLSKNASYNRRATQAVETDRDALARQRSEIQRVTAEIEELNQRRGSLNETLKESSEVEARLRKEEADSEFQAAAAAPKKAARAKAARAAAPTGAAPRNGAAALAEFKRREEAAAASRLALREELEQEAQATAEAQEQLAQRVLQARLAAATDPAQRLIIEQMQIERDLAIETAKIKENAYLTEAQQVQALAAIQQEAAVRTAAAQQQARAATVSQVQAWAGAGVAIAQALGEGDVAARASAGLQAIIAGADAFKYFAAGNIPGGIAATAAAIGYAKAAMMPSPPTPGSASSAPQPAKAAAPERSGGAGGGVTIHLHGIMTTKAEVGVGVAKALAKAKGTGMIPAAA